MHGMCPTAAPLKLVAGLLLLLLPASDCITVKDDDMALPAKEPLPERWPLPPSIASTYRVSLAKPQEPSNRVPAHLQDVLRVVGLSYDDADDVIHIIEPPKYFQQLKRRLQQRESGDGGGGRDAVVWQQQRKLHVHKSSVAPPTALAPAAMKVKDRGATTKVDLQQKRRRPVTASDDERRRSDLLMQATQLHQQPAAAVQHLHMPAGLPMEILASVRKTERLLHRSKPELGAAPAAVGPAKQRIKSKKVQTVAMEQHFEREKFHRGKEHKFGGEMAHGHRHKLRRSRRAVAQPYDQDKGARLLQHIADLLQNAETYLAPEAGGEKRPGGVESRLTGEIQPVSKPKNVYRILESSLNATDSLLQKLMIAQNATHSPTLCRKAASNTTANGLAQLQHSIDCMHRQMQSLEENDNIGNHKSHKRFGERSPVTEASSKRVKKQRKNKAISTAALLYDDVMTNIRNMLQAANLAPLEEEQQTQMAARKTDAAAPRVVPADEQAAPEHMQHLQQYLQELQQFVAQYPAPTELTLNTREFISAAVAEPTGPLDDTWYLINDSGSIYDAHLVDGELKPTANIFYRFPDIPNADRYLKKGPMPAAQSNVYELL